MLNNQSRWKTTKIVIGLSGVIILSLVGYDKYLHGPDTSEVSTTTEESVDENDTYTIPEEINNLIIGSEEADSAVASDKEDLLGELSNSFNEITALEDLQHSGWIPNWGYSDGLTSLNRNSELFDVVMPVWYGAVASGELVDRRPANITGMYTYTETNDVLLIPSIAMFDADLMKEILSGDSLDAHVNAIVNEVLTNGYDGIDLDYESTYIEDAGGYALFLEKLYKNLEARNKILSVTVLAKWGDDIEYTGLKQTREVQDWDMIDEFSHQVRIMTYDFTSSGSSVAGPIAPINWQRQVLEYAVEKFESKKVWLGVHLYGYAWSGNGYYRSYTYEDIPEILEEATYTEYNEILKEGYAEFPCDSLTCKIYYQTPEGVAARSNLASEYGIAGVAYWRLGADDGLLDDE